MVTVDESTTSLSG